MITRAIDICNNGVKLYNLYLLSDDDYGEPKTVNVGRGTHKNVSLLNEAGAKIITNLGDQR